MSLVSKPPVSKPPEFGPPVSSEVLAISFGSSTLYPTALQTLALPQDMNGQYTLLDGRLILNRQYHTHLKHATPSSRPKAKKSLLNHKQSVIPSCMGEHTDLTITVQKCTKYLEIRTAVRVGGINVHVDLASRIAASWGLQETLPCKHRVLNPLTKKKERQTFTTSVASPSVRKGNLL